MDKAHPLSGFGFGNGAVTLGVGTDMTRVNLRAGGDAVAALSKALGLALPGKPRGVSEKGARAALWLGPDEWLVLDSEGADLMASCAGVKIAHSAVDISHRNVAVTVSGPGASDTLNCACPLDLSVRAFPVGSATRTILAKAEVVLWRRGEQDWHVECWRSFATYVFALLEEGARDAAA